MNALIYFLLEGNYLLQRVGGAALSLKSPPTLPSIPRAVWFTRWPASTGESPASQLRASDAKATASRSQSPKAGETDSSLPGSRDNREPESERFGKEADSLATEY